MSKITVVIYIKEACSICDLVIGWLEQLQKTVPHQLIPINIANDKALQQTYGLVIPVIEVGPYNLKYPFTIQDLEMTLAAACDRKMQLENSHLTHYNNQIERGKKWSKADGVTLWFSKHYLFVFNLFVFVYVGIPFLAPIFMKHDLIKPAKIIYKTYSYVCHQLSYRSFFLFGIQPFYPKQAAGMDEWISYSEISGLSEDNFQNSLYASQQFVGNELAGYKVALCQRDVSTYIGILLFGILFASTGRRLHPLHWLLWIGLGLIPIGIDGITQLISQSPFNIIPYRESTPYFRVVTGGLFGFMTAWFGYPMVEITMKDTQKILYTKFIRLNQK